ncbi:Hypothetical_protein [Hexamita inflata]|uniref:Hypothetical_protein n=1 Tax=Hexamita inflata TaxID=28002 RepID=A0AA86TE21_9EUKA|nr:Hypothetical protein HINF_LOCUS1367 [Hexamita inflata]CAI9927685.1 Hypothetical protein HINF_LOCUS15330 [Hexamita inflata]
MDKLSQQDIYLISALLDRYKQTANYQQIIFDNLKLQLTLEEFKQVCDQVQNPYIERMKYQKELEKQIVKLLKQEELQLGDHFFFLVFQKIKQEYRQLLKFNTSIGEFGISYVEQKLKQQCYWEFEKGEMHQHQEIVLSEILLVINKGMSEKIITEQECNELKDYIKEVKDQATSRINTSNNKQHVHAE